MPRVDAPGLMRVVVDLERGLRELEIPFGIVGALVPELLLDVKPPRTTNDVDVTVVVEGLGDFDLLKDRLADYGFTRTRQPHRLSHRDGQRTGLGRVARTGVSGRSPPPGSSPCRRPTTSLVHALSQPPPVTPIDA